MSIVCKNCGNVFEGNYCNNCGQPTDTHPIDLPFVVHDLQHGIFHIHGGLFYSAKELFTRPGHAIRDYIEGKRVRHYKPISMMIVLATFYGLFYYTLGINIFTGKVDEDFDYETINEWIGHHFSIITIVLLPVLSFSSYVVFRKYRYNYTEHIIINAFYSTQKIWLRIFTLPLLVLSNKSSMLTLITQWLLLPDFVFMFWSYGQFFKNIPKFKIFWMVLETILLSLFFTTLLILLVVIVFLKKH